MRSIYLSISFLKTYLLISQYQKYHIYAIFEGGENVIKNVIKLVFSQKGSNQSAYSFLPVQNRLNNRNFISTCVEGVVFQSKNFQSVNKTTFL